MYPGFTSGRFFRYTGTTSTRLSDGNVPPHGQKLAGYSSEASPFDSFSDPLRQSIPDLFDIINKASRFFSR